MTFYITLIRHTEFDPVSQDLTQRGRDQIGFIADHILPIKKPRGVEELVDMAVNPECHLPPVDCIAHSELDRAVSTATILGQILSPPGKRPIQNLGKQNWLNETFYPTKYLQQNYSCPIEENRIDYGHFADFKAFADQRIKDRFRHLVLVTHHPALTAISMALLGRREVGDEAVYTMEHVLLRKSPDVLLGVTVSFQIKSPENLHGEAVMIGKPFLPMLITPAPALPSEKLCTLKGAPTHETAPGRNLDRPASRPPSSGQWQGGAPHQRQKGPR